MRGKHLLWQWDFRCLLPTVCGLLFGSFLCWLGYTSLLGLQEDARKANYDFPMPIYSGHSEALSFADLEDNLRIWRNIARFGFWVALISLPFVPVFGVKFCRRYFSAKARYQRIVDREERLEEERRRRREGCGQ